MPAPLFDLLPAAGSGPDEFLGRFLEYVDAQGLTLYPAQEEAILALLEGSNVILNTPTGSGKSLVAFALHFASMARGRRSVYTCPIKALVNEKWMALCREFGSDHIGLATGDATVNRDAPILCCTAEILANMALREGTEAAVDDVVMDEFHWYADRDRGVAWQVPLLTLPQARFLLMSATLGDVTFFNEELTGRTGRSTVTVTSSERPVPLEYNYSEVALAQAVERIAEADRVPVYVVHFTQKDAAESAQSFTSLKVATREEKKAIAVAIDGVRFSSPYGPRVRKWLLHGIGIHHAGLLPKYRVLVEQLAQRGLLKVICGTDTLGVGINVPIRTVLFSRLCKYDGKKTAVLSARDFHQIAGRAGRKGFDEQGFVMIQAPEHVIENLRLAEKAKAGKKVVKRQPPRTNFASWDRGTFERLVNARPERLASSFAVTHAMLLNVLSRPGNGCKAMRQLIRDSHESVQAKHVHVRRGWQLFRSLVSRGIVEFVAQEPDGARLRVNVELQDDFSMDETLSLYLLETIPLLDLDTDGHELDVLTLVESILENPSAILRRQLDKLRARAVGEMKADGLDYEQRMEELEKLEYPKPLADFVYSTFNDFADRHPWVGEENIRPKSIVREMCETLRSFHDYVQEYDLERTEGLLLRHLGSVYKVLRRTVPDGMKTDAVVEVELYLREMVGQVDSSLLDEWERMRDPANQSSSDKNVEQATLLDQGARDITQDERRFIAAVRVRIFAFLRAWSIGQDEMALNTLSDANGEATSWNLDRLAEIREAFGAEHGYLLLDPEGRSRRHTHIDRTNHESWRVEQMLIDSEQLNDWVAEFEVDLGASRSADDPVVKLRRLDALVT
tara:strand:+ start:3117 stop:5660 length:2544 start_codon:yes stop_codon:yes gene_type:complete